MTKLRARVNKEEAMITKGANRIPKAPFTREMRKDHTILIPMMAPIHFTMMKNILVNHGYRVALLDNTGPKVVEAGLKYVHNDICYPAMLVIGQMIEALQSGQYDVDKTALLMTQTGGGCRASNYVYLLRRALKKAGFEQVPVVSFNVWGMERNNGFQLTPQLLRQLIIALVYGDGLMLLSNQVKAYEREKGSAARLVSEWIDKISAAFARGEGFTLPEMRKNFRRMAAAFHEVERDMKPKIKVGIVGEIYVKYASLGNNNLEDFLASQDCEVMVPGMLDFILYTLDATVEKHRLFGGGAISATVSENVALYIQEMQDCLIDAVSLYPGFVPPSRFSHTKAMSEGMIGAGCTMGEGWLLTAEMLELTDKGYGNIVCTQPFGCLPNHICGKGMIRKIREEYPAANIVPIDYDPSATRVNQENRIKLMLAVAKENLLHMPESGSKPHRPDLPASSKLGRNAGGKPGRLLPQNYLRENPSMW